MLKSNELIKKKTVTDLTFYVISPLFYFSIYETSQGSKMHCHYCEKRALLDSTYSHLQQKLCIRNYDGEKIDEAVLPHEKNETKYPLCNTGELPGT